MLSAGRNLQSVPSQGNVPPGSVQVIVIAVSESPMVPFSPAFDLAIVEKGTGMNFSYSNLHGPSPRSKVQVGKIPSHFTTGIPDNELAPTVVPNAQLSGQYYFPNT